MNKQLVSAAAVLVALASSACQSPTSSSAEWSYEGETGPSHWGDLSPDYALAKTGRQQSPIDIQTSGVQRGDLVPIELDYQPTSMEVLNNGHTVEDDYHGGGHLNVGDDTFALAQFHFHAPSEHTIDGRHFPMEMHLVHRADDGRLAVVAVMIEAGGANPMLDSLAKHFPRQAGRAEEVAGTMVDATALLPDSLASYRYSGSLTTPPCSEGVAWFVLQRPIQASQSQIAEISGIIQGNNRPTQPLHGREIVASR